METYLLAFALLEQIAFPLQVPAEVWTLMREYLHVIFCGIFATFLYNYFVSRYLHIEGAFYFGIGCLFLLYDLYHALSKPGMSVVLTFLSLGTRVLLAYLLSAIPGIGVAGIWWVIPIG